MERTFLKQLRLKRKLTQKGLSKKLGLSTVYVRKLERGVVNPGIDTMIKYENFFNESMRKLFPDIFLSNSDKKLIKNPKKAI